ncbi:hypothetical protein [Parasphingorhabdus sp.]|uniref:hypothetical protein n=1 Tax=Parasphingorhabdus sp. TaxID=2709688 RepID=UPI003297D965
MDRKSIRFLRDKCAGDEYIADHYNKTERMISGNGQLSNDGGGRANRSHRVATQFLAANRSYWGQKQPNTTALEQQESSFDIGIAVAWTGHAAALASSSLLFVEDRH